jgi:hypothetical protein
MPRNDGQEILLSDQSNNPTGKSVGCFPRCLSSPFRKNISVFPKPKSPSYPRRPVPKEGRWPSSRTLGPDAVDAAALLTNGANADGEVVWF